MRPLLSLHWSTLWTYFCLTLTIAALGPSSVSSSGVGAKLQISQPGLDYAANIAVDVLTRNIQGKSIPDQRGSNKVEVGNVKWEVSNIRIVDFTKPETSVGVHPDTAVTWSIRNAGMKTEGSWKYEYKVWRFRARDQGSFTMTVRGGAATLRVSVGSTPTGQPTVNVLSCSCSIDGVSVRFSGGQSWLYNLFSGVINKILKRELEKMVCEEATKSIDKSGNEELATLNLQVGLGQGYGIDCSLLGNPVIGQGYIEFSHKGEAISPTHATPYPFPAPPFHTPPTPAPRMLTVYISQHLANTVGHAYHTSGVLSRRITSDDMRHAHSKDFLRTSCPLGACIGTLFPPAEILYPNSAVELNVATTESPTLAITPSGAIASFKGTLNVVAVTARGNVTLMSLGVTAELTLWAEIQGNRLKSGVISFVPRVNVVRSEIGELEMDQLNEVLEFGSMFYFVPMLNEIGESGVEIPSMEGVGLVGPTLELVDGGTVVSADVVYTR